MNYVKFQAFKGNNFANVGFELGGSLVSTAWRVLRLQMEETPSGMEGSCEYNKKKQSLTADKGWSSSWGGLGVRLTTPHRKK
jgi:hypothetical protein